MNGAETRGEDLDLSIDSLTKLAKGDPSMDDEIDAFVSRDFRKNILFSDSNLQGLYTCFFFVSDLKVIININL